ncbi:MAG TPA: response regulator transcription factor [Flavisolibacter sp.]|jgi:two-component system invasion response regulator UvrY|nr:response regulator transcription factor [Flavisolibacter sp.]
MNKITIIIVDDHRLVRETWSFILNSDARFKVIGECECGEDAVAVIPQLEPDVVIMDINLPGISGIDATEQIVQSGCRSKILGVSLHSDPNYARRMLQKGAMGYVTKNSAREEMFEAITRIRNGEKYICEEIKAILSKLLESTDLF